uniref:odorant receptor 13a-like n=1 Tax=Vespula vulgaris TaxID=7454 RepID=UPI00223B0D52
ITIRRMVQSIEKIFNIVILLDLVQNSIRLGLSSYVTLVSKKLAETYYHCNWEEMPRNCKSSLLICIICSQSYLSLTAGKFYTFSLYGFTGIVKTSMAYLSMLRTIV